MSNVSFHQSCVCGGLIKCPVHEKCDYTVKTASLVPVCSTCNIPLNLHVRLSDPPQSSYYCKQCGWCGDTPEYKVGSELEKIKQNEIIDWFYSLTPFEQLELREKFCEEKFAEWCEFLTKQDKE